MDDALFSLPYFIGMDEQPEPFNWDDWVASFWAQVPSTGLATILEKHRFVQPDGEQIELHHCANGWVGSSWPRHIQAVINEYRTSGTDTQA